MARRLALAIILGAAILSMKAMGLRAAAFAHLDLDKHDLGLVRLAHFLALAYVMSAIAMVEPWATRMSRIFGSRIGQSFQGMGRNSLLFFALVSVASAGGRALMGAAHSLAAPHLSIHSIGFVYTVAAVITNVRDGQPNGATARPRGLSTENSHAAAVPINSLRPEGPDGVAAT